MTLRTWASQIPMSTAPKPCVFSDFAKRTRDILECCDAARADFALQVQAQKLAYLSRNDFVPILSNAHGACGSIFRDLDLLFQVSRPLRKLQEVQPVKISSNQQERSNYLCRSLRR